MHASEMTEDVRAVLRSLEIDPDSVDLRQQLQFTKTGRLRSLLGNSFKTRLGEARQVLTAVMHLSPEKESGFNTCPFATSCPSVCIKKTGRLVTEISLRARISKTLLLRLFPDEFMRQLRLELDQHCFLAGVKGMQPAVRLNGTSDVLWEKYEFMEDYQNLQFYDYSKVPLEKRSPPANYHLTFSLSEDRRSMGRALTYLREGRNAAAVFQSWDGTTRATAKAAVKALVKRGAWTGYPVISGDEDDIRFWDPPGHWVALYAKGPATKDLSGFVQRLST